ncbi:tryptophan--tRNA ligase, mitochondrial-like [Pollicipes pollicipes]|uniref:tryptophan--tRNA ligase, mitochondrial-like n=1 Tax=Pollicipes pollicipes TaxID=41117 RepID=UPI00188583FF|nr:tryptophan--tRNA ligase, mitochondrial-like [Pollicipes pollicipes]XP_037083076.1 tryptophan--tRNA ligase, mitochondrial-like [Pollicipes pollicipes]
MTLRKICGLSSSLVCHRRFLHDTKARSSRVFSGVQPTGNLHLGNYFGAIQRWVELQETDKELIFCIVDLHSLTVPQRRADLSANITRLTAGLLACGIDPERATLFLQSAVPQHTQLGWVLSCLTTMPRLGQLPQYREKAAEHGEVPLGLYLYPVLQAADILLYRATEVPVGQDQLQNIQLAQHLGKAFNRQFGKLFPHPKAVVDEDAGGRVRSLRDPSRKMSKSDPDSRSCVYLNDPPERIRSKLKLALTDFTSEVFASPERPAVTALMTLHALAAGLTLESVRSAAAGLTTAQYKLLLADVLAERLAPVRDAWARLEAEPRYLSQVLERGRQRAAEEAEVTWRAVVDRVQLRLS